MNQNFQKSDYIDFTYMVCHIISKIKFIWFKINHWLRNYLIFLK